MVDLFDFNAARATQPTSRELAQSGIDAAVEHADRVEEGWSERALGHVRLFAGIRHEFLGEDVRTWAHEQGLPLPPMACAWGAVMLRAARERIVVRAGYRTTRIPPQHAKPAVLWQSLIWEPPTPQNDNANAPEAA